MSEAINLKTRRNPRQCGDLEARRAGEMTAWGGAKRSPEDAKRMYPASKHTVGEFAGFGWSVSGCPGGGREFGNATDWKIAQPGQH
jgi:hypothetical protein